MNRIKELRVSMKLTQRDVAEKIGFNQTVVGKYERNELEPNIATLKKLSELFECSVDYIIGHSDDFGNITIKESSISALSADEQLLLNDFRALSRSDKAQVREYARYLAQKKGK